jgi:hypothetical protein
MRKKALVMAALLALLAAPAMIFAQDSAPTPAHVEQVQPAGGGEKALGQPAAPGPAPTESPKGPSGLKPPVPGPPPASSPLNQISYQYLGYAAIALVGLILLPILRRRRGGHYSMGSALVLRKFAVDETAADGVVLHIVGRKPGLIAYLLTVIGFDAETSLSMNEDEILIKTSSLSGQIHQLVPLPNVSSTQCGYYKPIGLLICGIVFFVLGIVAGIRDSGVGLLLFWVLGGILFASYWLSKSMLISIETMGGMFPLGLRFKPSVIEGVSVDIQKVLQAVRLINQRVVAAQGRAVAAI